MLTKANSIEGNYMFDNIFLNLSSTNLANEVYLLRYLKHILNGKVSIWSIPNHNITATCFSTAFFMKALMETPACFARTATLL